MPPRNSLLVVSFAGALALYSGACVAQLNLSAETTVPGGAPYLTMTHLSEVASDKGIANLQIQSGQTLTNSVLNVAEGRTDIAPAPLILPFLLQKGRGPYSKQGEAGAALAGNLRALYPYNFGAISLFAFDSTNLNGWDGLKGKTVFNGPPRGAALTIARQMIQLVAGLKEGDDYKGLQVNWGQTGKTISDGSADAFVIPGTFPSDRIITATGSGKVTLWSIPKAKFADSSFSKWASAPGNAPVMLKVNDLGYGDSVTVVSEDDSFRAVVTTGAEIVHKDMDVQLAKALTAAHIATLDALKAKAPFARNISLAVLDAVTSGFCGAMPLKYHPGAVAAWEEAGYKVPDCAKG
ncbi:MAG: TAXI family TRAP transporter solute-binding subunit [Burkholderiaceae bacterium]